MRSFIFYGIISLLIISASGATQGDQGCSLTMEGKSSQSVMLTDLGLTREISIQGSGSCNLTLLVVGGGGDGHRDTYGGGGASGHLEYRSLQVSPGMLLISEVGDQREASSVV